MNNLAAQGAFLLSQRTDFKGRTDKYATSNKRFGSLGDAQNGFGPFDVTKSLFDDKSRDIAINRINRYRVNWRFFRGEHHEIPFYDAERKPVYNFCGIVVNKAVEFYAAKGWRVKMGRGNEQAAAALDMIWEYNSRSLLTQRLKQYAAVTGDSYLYVTVCTTDPQTLKPLAQKDWKVCLIPMNPSYCFPVWDSAGNIVRILIQYPSNANDPMNSSLVSIVITPDTFQVFQDDNPMSAPQPNPFGMVNVVQFKNLPLAYSNSGMSDIDDIISLNMSYNNVAFAIERIIRYHGEPTTIIQGAKATSLEKGANKVWSNIPVDGKVFNLEMSGDLSGMRDYMTMLKSQMCEVAETPLVVLDGSNMPHSNTPGVALELMFKPLIDKTQRSRDCAEPSFRLVNKLIRLAQSNIIGEPLEALADYPERLDQVSTEWSSAMPRDQKYDLEVAQLKQGMGLISKAKLIRDFGDYDDTRQAAVELAADKMAELANAAELARAQQGIPPVLSTAFLGSQFLTEDLNGLADEVAALDEKFPKKMEPFPTSPQHSAPTAQQ